MLLFAITKNQVKRNIGALKSEEFKKGSFIITIVTDGFLSSFFKEKDGFSIFESPFKSKEHCENLFFLKIKYDQNEKLVRVMQSTISGRPLYYHINSKGEFYCSTHISLLKKAGVQIRENKKALPEFFVYRYVMPPRTLYQGIYKILNGSSIQVKLKNGKWSVLSIQKPILRPVKNFHDPHQSPFEATRDLLVESVKTLGSSKNNISILFSGGLDSSILCKILQNNYNLKYTYSGGYPFERPENNIEKKYALSASKALGTTHFYYEPTVEQYLTGLIETIHSCEEPAHHLQTVIFYLMFKNKIHSDKKIMICGLGADGIFGSELHAEIFRANKKLWKCLSVNPFVRVLELLSKITHKGEHFIKFLRTKQNWDVSPSHPNSIIWRSGKYGSEDWACNYFNVKKEEIISGRYDFIKSFENEKLYDLLSMTNFLGSASVTQALWSKCAESNRKIVYYPFNYEPLLNYAYSLDWNVKLKKPKNVLRHVARILKIPEFIINRKKSGFGADAHWAERGGAFEPLIPLISKVFNEDEIRKMQSSDPKRSMTYWNMINYGLWKRLFINNEPIEKLLSELREQLKISI